MRNLMWCALLLAACGGGGSADTCKSINDEVAKIAALAQTCTVASDYTSVSGGCGESDACGVTVNKANAAQLGALDDQWQKDGCGAGNQCAPCPGPVTAFTCDHGVCGGGVR